MNKKGDDNLIVIIIMLLGMVFVYLFINYGIYNPIIKISQGCWEWERDKIITNYSLTTDYNYTCENIRDMILIENYPELTYKKTDTFCKEKLIKTETSTYNFYGIKDAYLKECIEK